MQPNNMKPTVQKTTQFIANKVLEIFAQLCTTRTIVFIGARYKHVRIQDDPGALLSNLEATSLELRITQVCTSK
jgi:hypothetical protein